VWTSGKNDKGQLGQAEIKSSKVPKQIPGMLIYVLYVVFDDVFPLLHYFSSSKLSIFILSHVIGLTAIEKISVGSYCNFAIDTEGKLFAWGDNLSGQLGMRLKEMKK
jgi:alpha-tubulin suppressor-like RCC1 family protein